MKIVKKYEYKLTEETLDKDIDTFIKEARKGAFEWDHKYGMEGLRIIKQYFKLTQNEFDKGDFPLCKECYKKLLYLLFEEGYENSYFGYEDIVGRSNLDFEKIIRQYFICLIRVHSVDEVFHEFIEYLKKKQDYYFEAAEKTITTDLRENDFTRFGELLLLEAGKIGKEDYELHDVLSFLLNIAKKKDEKEFLELAQKFAPALGYESVKEFLEEYE
jgi:superfamily I DNA/RNA helicase